FGLWLVGILFPELKDAGKYLWLGHRLLEQESAQIFPDGSYSMYSMNYHRFVLQIYFCALRLGELHHRPFSETVKRRVAKSVDYLYQLIEIETGQMPVYGSNDGALVLPLNNCDFTDYRPLLQLGSYLIKGTRFFESGAWDEPLYWLCGADSLSQHRAERREQSDRSRSGERTESSFPDGGIYILRSVNSKAIIRCTDFRSRPSHADQLHVDLWMREVNIACDAGTYLYSGKGIWRNGLAHTSVHNTVIVDHQDQMKMVSRFTWTNWAKGKVLQQDEKFWQGEHNGYKRLADPVTHKRTVLLSLGRDRWLVVDHLSGKQTHHYALHWLFCDGNYGVRELTPAKFGIWLEFPGNKLPDSNVFIQMGLLEGKGNFSVVRGDENSTRGWRSRYYGEKEPAISVLLETNGSQAAFWSFFGFSGDEVELTGNTLIVNSDAGNEKIDMSKLNE
ncbi:MAG TPA: alginate lyase family protein, partial [Anaerolineales bacterium]|nr:alginate lyase family protein [Anaerolineales bacterium]